MLYKRIKERREYLGLTQEELAKRMGYKSRSSINKIEIGENDIPQSKIEQFAKVLETTPAYLMGWDDMEEDELDRLLVQALTKLTPDEEAKVLAFVQGMIANRAD